jgi:hypothetical protein
MLRLDPEATDKLVKSRVPCNEALAEHPTIQCGIFDGTKQNRVGLLGVLNGLFGCDANGCGAIAMVIEGENNDLIEKFIILEKVEG